MSLTHDTSQSGGYREVVEIAHALYSEHLLYNERVRRFRRNRPGPSPRGAPDIPRCAPVPTFKWRAEIAPRLRHASHRRMPDSDALAPFHPIVRTWFTGTLGEPSAPQKAGWPAIAAGSDTLILAPTGTGKTLAAFLYELDQLVTEGLEAPLANAVHLLYVSPLKALNNDVQRNLELPLAQLKERFETAGEKFPEIRVAVRPGDTPASARAMM